MLSEKRLEEAFPGKGVELRELLTKQRDTKTYASVQAWTKQRVHPPCYHDRLMTAINEVLEGHGVEAVGRPCDQCPDAEYINMGDTYATTIIFDFITGTFKLQSWGDWVEIAERRGAKYA